MTTYTEANRPLAFLLSEAPGTLSRETITVVSGAGVVLAGTVLGKITASTATAAAFSGNTGNGTMGTITLSAGAKVGDYKLVILEPGTDAGKFLVEDPDGKIIGTGAVAAAFSKSGLAFTLADGSTDFVAGDGFTITVAAGSGKYTPYDDGLSLGAETAVAINLYAVDATSTDVSVAAIVRLAEVKSAELQWHSSADNTAKAAAAVSLATKHIVVRG